MSIAINNSRQNPWLRNSNLGFGMVEVLVVMLLIAASLFGITRLSTSALSGSDYANQQKQIELARQYILEKINANLKLVNGVKSAAHYAESSYAADKSGAKICANGTSCTQDEQALYDLYLWKQYLATFKINSLQAIVCKDNASPGVPSLANPNCNSSGGQMYIKMVWRNHQNISESQLNTLKDYLIIPVLSTTDVALFKAWTTSGGGGSVPPFTPIDISGINPYWSTSWWPNNMCDNNEKCNGTAIFGACSSRAECVGSIMDACYDGSDRCNNSIVFGQCDASNNCDNSMIFGNCNSQVNNCSDSIISNDCNASSDCSGSVILGNCNNSKNCSNSIIYGDCTGDRCSDSIIYGNCYGKDCTGSYVAGNCSGKCGGAYVGGSCWGKGCGSLASASIKDGLLAASAYTITSSGGWLTIKRSIPLSYYNNQVNIDTMITKKGGTWSSYNCSNSDCSNAALYGRCSNGASCDGSAIYGASSTSCSGSGTSCRNATIENGCSSGADCSNSVIKGDCSGSGTSCQNAKISGTCSAGADCRGSICKSGSGSSVAC